jgi:hypothetical protein
MIGASFNLDAAKEIKKNSTCRGMTAPRLYIKKKPSHAGRENPTNPASTHIQGPVTGENAAKEIYWPF